MTPLWTTADVARFLNVTPAWVREHAANLGGSRLHAGPKAPLRFDPDRVRAHVDRGRVTVPGQPRPRRRPGPARKPADGFDAHAVLPLPD